MERNTCFRLNQKLLIICGVMLLFAWNAGAQQPKLYLKAYAGIHAHSFIYKEEVKSSDYFVGWQGGFGFRVSYRKIFGEVDFSFIRSGIIIFLEDSISQEIGYDQFDFRLNAFELPFKFGVIPVKTPFFKWYLYSGTSIRFNTKGKLKLGADEFILKPKDVNLANPNIDWIVGTQMDIGWLNVDLIYGLGLTNSTQTNIRTNSQELLLNIGFLF